MFSCFGYIGLSNWLTCIKELGGNCMGIKVELWTPGVYITKHCEIRSSENWLVLNKCPAHTYKCDCTLTHSHTVHHLTCENTAIERILYKVSVWIVNVHMTESPPSPTTKKPVQYKLTINSMQCTGCVCVVIFGKSK